MRDFIKVMKALSDPSRVKLVKALQYRELCVCEMTEAVGLAQSTVSKHLKILEEAGLVAFRKDGLWVNYRLADPPGNPYAASMLDALRGWLADEAPVAEMIERLPEIHREKILGAD